MPVRLRRPFGFLQHPHNHPDRLYKRCIRIRINLAFHHYIETHNTTSATSPTHSPTTTAASSGGLTGKARTGAIVGATVGSVALFALLAWLFICIRSRRRADGTAGGKSNPNNAKPPTAENREAHAGLMSASNFHIVHYDENNRANER
jgi:hypothetical protein